MKIGRNVADFGNSFNNFMVDGYYFELATNVVKISKKKAEDLLVDRISNPEDLLDRLLISTEIEGEESYYLVGQLAEDNQLANSHVNKMHDKIKSPIPYISFLGAIAYYHALNADNEDNIIEIDYMSMMLPIWLLKREEKFSIAHKKMEERFSGEHKVKVLTPGMEKELTITVQRAKCLNESEIARHSLKYKMVAKDKNSGVISIEKRQEAEKFDDYEVVLTDIGGGSTDAVRLGKGLTTPKHRDSFQVIDIEPFLGYLERFRKEKLIQFFKDLRTLEKFIVNNYKEQRYVLMNENTGEEYTFTDEIVEALQEYARILVAKVLDVFIPSSTNTVLKFIYIGGEAPVLEPYIRQALLDHMSETAAENNHFFLTDIIKSDEKEVFTPTSRTINLVALELKAINETKEQLA
ncbi:ParM/StbA family protein [Bacillus sp. BP-3]|uniref:ParM/StbA family protein n=1 Tax=Bacillus sp. BP-3 TaxID=3022773 RepID=UPI002330C4F6|nr:ParM/StbA family protein [Bacillus sp. BP-3]MDC2867328.1 ParM/StbA family protein [Bacillus sp. BP-3]